MEERGITGVSVSVGFVLSNLPRLYPKSLWGISSRCCLCLTIPNPAPRGIPWAGTLPKSLGVPKEGEQPLG